MSNTRTALDLDRENIKKVKAVAALEGVNLSKWIESAIIEKLNKSIKNNNIYKSLATPAIMRPDSK